jgi:hypothetical protein
MDLSTDLEKNEKISESMKGNQNAKKGKLFYDQLRRVLVQNDNFKLRQVTEKLVDAAIEGEPWAVKEVIDRMDGKAVQATEISGPDGAELVKGIAITFVEPDGNKEG